MRLSVARAAPSHASAISIACSASIGQGWNRSRSRTACSAVAMSCSSGRPGGRVLRGEAGDVVGRAHRLLQRRTREVGGAGIASALADVDRHAQRLVAVALDVLDLAQAHRHRQAAALRGFHRRIARAELACEGERVLHQVLELFAALREAAVGRGGDGRGGGGHAGGRRLGAGVAGPGEEARRGAGIIPSTHATQSLTSPDPRYGRRRLLATEQDAAQAAHAGTAVAGRRPGRAGGRETGRHPDARVPARGGDHAQAHPLA